MAQSNEPLIWLPFSVGGMVAAMFMPITIVITGIAVPLGWISGEELFELVRHPLGRCYLFVLIALPFYHWAHRFQFTLRDMGLKRFALPIQILCYGTAIGATICAGWMLVRL